MDQLRNKWIEECLDGNEPQIEGIDEVKFGKPVLEKDPSCEYIHSKHVLTNEALLEEDMGELLDQMIEGLFLQMYKRIREKQHPLTIVNISLYLYQENDSSHNRTFHLITKIKNGRI